METSKILRNDKKPIPTLHEALEMVSTAEGKADAFATSLEIDCLNNEHESEYMDFTEEVEEEYDNEPESGQLAPSSFDEARGIIKSMSAKKPPGGDQITNRAIKHLPLKATVFLTAIINGIL